MEEQYNYDVVFAGIVEAFRANETKYEYSEAASRDVAWEQADLLAQMSEDQENDR